MIPQGTELIFDKQGIHVTLDGAYELVGWNRVKGVKKEWNMIVIFTGGGRGYMLTDRVLGNEKEEFYNYMKAHVKAS